MRPELRCTMRSSFVALSLFHVLSLSFASRSSLVGLLGCSMQEGCDSRVLGWQAWSLQASGVPQAHHGETLVFATPTRKPHSFIFGHTHTHDLIGCWRVPFWYFGDISGMSTSSFANIWGTWVGGQAKE